MTPLFWASIAVGLAIVAAAVGIPYYRTHRRMRHHYDAAEAHAYLNAKEQADEDVLPEQAPHPGRQASVATRPIGQPQPAEAEPAEEEA